MPNLGNAAKLDVGAAVIGMNGKDGIANGNTLTITPAVAAQKQYFNTTQGDDGYAVKDSIGNDVTVGEQTLYGHPAAAAKDADTFTPKTADIMPGFKLQIPNIVTVAATFSLGQNGCEGADSVEAKNTKFTFKNLEAGVDFGPVLNSVVPGFSSLAVAYYGRNLAAGKTTGTSNTQSSSAIEVGLTLKPAKFEIYYFGEFWLSAEKTTGLGSANPSIGGYSRDAPWKLALSDKSTDNKALDMRLRVGYNLTDWFEPKVEVRWWYYKNSSSTGGQKGHENKLLISPELQFTTSPNSKLFVGYQLTTIVHKAKWTGAGSGDNDKTWTNGFTFGGIIKF
jgi:hypothetical protein